VADVCGCGVFERKSRGFPVIGATRGEGEAQWVIYGNDDASREETALDPDPRLGYTAIGGDLLECGGVLFENVDGNEVGIKCVPTWAPIKKAPGKSRGSGELIAPRRMDCETTLPRTVDISV
jgi:hypothetical protein